MMNIPDAKNASKINLARIHCAIRSVDVLSDFNLFQERLLLFFLENRYENDPIIVRGLDGIPIGFLR